MKLQKLVERIISEEFGNKPVICNLDLNKLVDNYDDSLFGEFQEHIDNKGFDIKISKSLCLDNQVIGGCLLKKYSILSEIKNIIWHSKNTDGFNNLKFFVNKDFLDKISNKRGIFIDFIYINNKYNGKNYGKILIDYSKSLGDYTWGISVPNETEDYWLNKQNSIKILEFEDSIGKASIIININ